MTLTAPAPARRRRRRQPVANASLGWGILDWTHRHLRNPLNDSEPFVFTDDQAARVVEMYRVNPDGRRVYRRIHIEDAKGSGKSPAAAAVALAEFCGPVCFGEWDADGEPVGVPWGTHGYPAPWVQMAACSEDQTFNTYRYVQSMATADGGRVARDLALDPGVTRLYRKDIPGVPFLERVTASAGSREGQALTFAVLDEPQGWLDSNGGTRLAQVILRNLAKMNGTSMFTGNAPVLGEGSVAETYRDPSPGVLHLAHRPAVPVRQDDPPDVLRARLAECYPGVWWDAHLFDRLLEEIADPSTPWPNALRFYFNTPILQDYGEPWLGADEWAACESAEDLAVTEPSYASVRVARDYRSAAVAVAQRHGDRVVVRCRTFEADDLVNGDVLDLGDVEEYLLSLAKRYPARVTAEVHFRPGSKPQYVPRPGPEVTFHGAFFQRSRQVLEARGLVLLEQPDSPARLAPAAAQLRGLVREKKLAHDGDPDLTRHMVSVVARETQGGAMPVSPADVRIRIDGALAAMHAVGRALIAERPVNRTMHLGGSL